MKNNALRTRRPSFFLTAAVSGVFTTLACALLLFNFAYRVPDPLETPEFLALKDKLRAERDSEVLRQEIRDLDLSLREDYFRRRRFATLGTYLLLGGMAVALVTAKAAATLQRRLPNPTAPNGMEEREKRELEFALWGVGALSLLLVAASIGLWTTYQSALPDDLAQLAGVEGPDEPPGGVSPNSKTHQPNGVVDPSHSDQPQRDQHWPRFRGPMGSGISADPDMPTSWNATTGEGVAWKVKVPLPGKNSAVCWQDNVFVTGATEERREIYCFDADTGDLRWARETPNMSANAEPPEVNQDTGFAAPTAATDGVRVYASFANGDCAAFDFQGKQVWFRNLGVPKNAYGHASSLALYGSLVILQLDQGGMRDNISKLLALDSATGKTEWEVGREVPNSWTTPIVIEHEGRPLVITCANPWVIAYDPRDGAEIWRSKCLSQDVGPSPIYAGGLVYAANVFPGVTAIRPDGQGDVTESHAVWFSDWETPDTCSPLVVGDLLVLLTSFGLLMGYDAAQGSEEPLWEEEFDDGFRASPGLAGENIYLFGESGKVWVVRATREACQIVSECELGESCVASPAFHQGRIYIRGSEHLFCIGKG